MKRVLNKNLQASTKLLGCFFLHNHCLSRTEMCNFFYLYIADKTKIYLSKKNTVFTKDINKPFKNRDNTTNVTKQKILRICHIG